MKGSEQCSITELLLRLIQNSFCLNVDYDVSQSNIQCIKILELSYQLVTLFYFFIFSWIEYCSYHFCTETSQNSASGFTKSNNSKQVLYFVGNSDKKNHKHINPVLKRVRQSDWAGPGVYG